MIKISKIIFYYNFYNKIYYKNHLLVFRYDKSLSKPQQFQHITSSKIDALRKKVEERKALRLEKKGDRKLI